MNDKTVDPDLKTFAASGAAPLPTTNTEGYVEHDGARLWYAVYGSGFPLILLHGGLGNSRNWGYQVPALVAKGYRAVLIDSRGHGHSTRDTREFRYDLMATDVLAVMDQLHIGQAALVGWSDGAVISLIIGMTAPARVAGVFFFGCKMHLSGTREITELTPILENCLKRHEEDYAQLSPTPTEFKSFAQAVQRMHGTQPNYSAPELAEINVPVTIVQSEQEEFIKQEHAEYLAKTIPNAQYVFLNGVSHFAPLQNPKLFNEAMLAFADRVAHRG
jgi:pimeloyl-ACP methyl ester carboxylesterase